MSTSIETVVEVYDELSGLWTAEFGELAENPEWEEDGGTRWILPAELPFYVDMTAKEWTEDGRRGLFGFNQNYDAFAMMANVRNWNGLVPMVPELRGLPDDISVQTATLAAQDNYDNAASWLTLGEIQAYDWEHVVDRTTSDGHLYKGVVRDMPTVQRLRLVMERMAALGASDKVRMVFWFMS